MRVWILLMSLNVFVIAQKISDVQSADAAYSAIKHSLDNGYFTLFDNQAFMPNHSVTRSEMALILQRLDVLTKKNGLSNADLVELKAFSNRFKSYLEQQKTSSNHVGTEVSLLQDEQKTIHYDMSRLTDQVQHVEEKHNQQQLLLWVAIGLSSIAVLK